MIHPSVIRKCGLGFALLAWACMPALVRGGGLTAIASFNGTNGGTPYGGVTFDANGNLFGTAFTGGGSNEQGTVWEIAKGSSTITLIASFNGTNGANPEAGASLDASGNLFGTAAGGGANGYGAVWEIAKGTGTLTALASFNLSNGDLPQSGVTLDANGNLFGTTFGGPAYGQGIVWEIAKGSGTITALAAFNRSNGAGPTAGVTLDANGNLFGTASRGGDNNLGTVWEIAKGSGTITTLASFNGSNGANPTGNVTLDANGNLLGTTNGGGANGYGAVWEIAKGTSTLTALASFNGSNGAIPGAGVTLDANGNLLGTAQEGGANHDGTVWEIAKGGSIITALASFDGTNGLVPFAGVTLDANGNLFGTAAGGGDFGQGTVWEIQAASVPEPSSIVIGLIGMALAGGFVMANRASARRSRQH